MVKMCLTQLAERNDQQMDVIMNVKCGPDTDAFCQSEYKSIIYNNVTCEMTNCDD